MQQQYKNQYGTIFAVKDHNGAPAIMCRAEHSETWSLSSMIEPFTPGAWTAEELQARLDSWAATKGWQPVAEPASAEPPEIVDEGSGPEEECPYLQPLENSKKYNCQCSICGDKFVNREICNKSFRSCGWYLDRQDKEAQTEDDEEEASTADVCQCRTCGWESCFAHGCAKECPANAEESCLTVTCPEYIERTDTTCNCQTTAAPTGAAAATTDGSAAPEPPQAAETTTTSESGADARNSPSAPADTSAQSPQAEDAAPATPTTAAAASGNGSLPAFDYSGLDADTAEHLQKLARRATQAKQRYILDMMEIVVEAHRELVALCDKHNNQHSESTFRAWCASIGVSKDTAYRLLQVQALMDGSTPEEQAVLADAPAKLLYAAAKPSAPPELVQAVKDRDITTAKEFRELEAQLKAERAAREKAEQECEEAVTHIKIARELQIDTARERDTALRRAAEAEKQRDGARDALAAAKLRGDKLKAENDALKAHPIEAQVVDEEEIDRRAQARANELTAPLREELEALRNRHPADLEEAEQAIRDAYDSTIYTGRVIENAWHTLRPLLPCMDAERRELAIRQLSKTIATIQGEIAACL